MGAHKNTGYDKFPAQSGWVGKRVEVCFHYDTNNILRGVLVRDDRDEPFVSIIRLDDGRHILSTECMFAKPEESTLVE